MSIIMVSGESLGNLKSKRDVHMIDLFDTLMAAMGGSLGYTFEPRLLGPGDAVFDSAYQRPFEFASDGDVYTLVKVDLKDTAYVDRDRRRNE